MFLFAGVIIKPTLRISYIFKIHSTPFPWKGGIFNVKLGSVDGHEMAGGNSALDSKEFKNYSI